MRRVIMAVVAAWLMVAAIPVGATPTEAPLEWVSYWEEDSAFSYFWDKEAEDSFFLSDTSIERFRIRKAGTRIVVDVRHEFGDGSGAVTVRNWGRNGTFERGYRGSICGEWDSWWKVLDPRPLQKRFKRAGLSPIVPKGRGSIDGCLRVEGDGVFDLRATIYSDVYWKRSPSGS